MESKIDDKYDSIRLENQICFPLYACAKEVIRQYRKPLENQGYIKRIRPETNERKLFVELTEAGDALRDQATEVPCEMEGCLRLDQDEQQQLKELLDKAIIKMEI